MPTFIDLYTTLQKNKDNDIKKWLSKSWKGIDKQESLLRLFAGLGLFSELAKFRVCNGNFNKGTIKGIISIRDIFYENNKPKNLKDKGDKSDLTLIDENTIIAISSKNNEKQQGIGKYDIAHLLYIFTKKYPKTTNIIGICTRYKDELLEKARRANSSSLIESNCILSNQTIIIDWSDLNEAFHHFKKLYGNTNLDDIINNKIDKYVMLPRPHQEYSIDWTLYKMNNDIKEVIWGHIPRSGKSYIMTGLIIADRTDKCNYLIITTAPNETVRQYMSALRCQQLHGFNVIHLNNKKIGKPKTKNNIIICSKQFLQIKTDKMNKNGKILEKTLSIKWLSEMKFKIRFLDEAHFGGTTSLSKTTLKKYGNGSFTVYMTATYLKPTNSFQISKDNILLWDLEDVVLCKDYIENYDRLNEKHGPKFIKIFNKYSDKRIMEEYNRYPDLHILTNELTDETVEKVIKATRDNDYGYSTSSALLLNQDINGNTLEEFQNNEKALDIFYQIFGKYDELGIPDEKYPDKHVFMRKIENKCKEYDSRYMSNHNEPLIIMCFLPQNNINELSNTVKKLLEDNEVISDYDIVIINSKISNNPKDIILEAAANIKHTDKKGILVLSGKQCSVGITINNCDVVILLNNSKSYDMIYQMMFRCMTEGYRKRCGFVIDLDIYRVSQICMDYSYQINPNLHQQYSLKYLFEQRIINVNEDNFKGIQEDIKSYKINKMTEYLYKIGTANSKKYIDTLLSRLSKYELFDLTSDEANILKCFKISQTKIVMSDGESKIKNGIKTVIVKSSNKPKEVLEEIIQKRNFMDILKHIIPLVCILTISSESMNFEDMYNEIICNEIVRNIFLEQLQSWWGNSIVENTLKKLICIYIEHMSDNTEVNQLIKTIKEIFLNSKDDMNELSKNVDKYLIPQELEKKNNAEVSTPYVLRNEMLDKIPSDFWTKPQKVFEPCSGKGGFLVDIVNRFMNGLTKLIPDKEERYRVIVEDCLYFSDINKTNIFICELLLDPDKKGYKLNSNLGDTLKLDIAKKWDLGGFDTVIGNPPYNSSGSTGTGNTIWQHFTKKSLNMWLNKEGYLCFVHPPGWRKPNTKRGKFYGLYKLMSEQNQMLYLSIHGIKDGQQTFNCGTRYDWYIIEKKNKYKNTIINDEKGKIFNINMNNFHWLPNYNFDIIEKILAKKGKKTCNIMQSMSAYEPRKTWMSKTKNSEFKYPCIHSTPKKGTRYMYSKYNNKGHYGIPKIIFGESGIYNPVIDINGKYGMTHGAMGIKISSKDEGDKISAVLTSEKFQDIIKSCNFSSFRIDWNIFRDMKKDFWKEFV